MVFDVEPLANSLRHLPTPRRYLVAYSGGVDSHALLGAMARLRTQLQPITVEAVHVNHRLTEHSEQWARHCRTVCQQLGVRCTVLEIDATPRPGESPEAAAREARYEALRAQISDGDAVLTAHQADDQAETVLLQLLRGAGVRGLAGMLAVTRWEGGWLLRPLLEFSRSELLAYATTLGLSWIEDASNQDLRFDRNRLRHQVLPILRQRWPAVSRRLTRSAQHCAEAQMLLDERAQEDLAAHRGESSWEAFGLEVQALRRLSPARQRNLLRYWIRERGLPVPDQVHLERILTEVLPARHDATPYLHWRGGEVRRFQGRVYALSPLPSHEAQRRWRWDGLTVLPLPGGAGTLRGKRMRGAGVPWQWLQGQPLWVGFRQGGERCAQPAMKGSKALKSLLQECHIPPWLRDRIPLIFANEVLLGVADLWTCYNQKIGPDQLGLVWLWEPLPEVFPAPWRGLQENELGRVR